MTIRIDAHQHFLDPARGDYGWLAPDDPLLGRVHGPAELVAHLEAGRIDRTILVQAAPTVNETDYLLDIAGLVPQVAGVVGWIDFQAPDLRGTLDRLARHPRFLGVRPMVQDMTDDDWIAGDDLAWAFEALVEMDLTFDAVGFTRHARAFATVLERYPDLRAVIDHGLKPPIADGMAGFDDWAAGIDALAATGASCKLSGLVTEAGTGWTTDDLRPWAEHLIGAFGADRLMWGSDWPLVRRRADYADWLAAAEALTAGLDDAGRAQVFGGTAAAFYRVGGAKA